jgi:hypothetical protein
LCEFRSVGEISGSLELLGHTKMTFDEMDVYCQRLSRDPNLNMTVASCREWVDLVVSDMRKDNLLVADSESRLGAVFLFAFPSTSRHSIISENDLQTLSW